MECRECRFDNPAGMKFCGQCGTQLSEVCRRCGTEVTPGFKFCGVCGQPLASGGSIGVSVPGAAVSPSQPPPASEASSPVDPATSQDERPHPTAEGEIKQVTVLCSQLHFEPADALDPEIVHDLLSRFLELAREEVQRYGGQVDQLFDRGFLALFGAEVAYEDHARRAALAAWDLRNRVAGLASEIEARQYVRWATRMGLDSGAVVVGGARGMTVGEASRRARQLQQQAEPGVPLIGADTARLVRTFVDMEAADPPETDGGSTTEVWRMRGLRSELSPLVSDKARSPFVGRVRELALLEELRERAEQQEGQLVAIAGEAGSGKSRLLYELRKTLRGRPVSYLRGQCVSFGAGIPYLPLIDMIRRGSRIAASDDESTVVKKLGQSLELIGTDREAALPYLLRLLEAEGAIASLDELEPQALQQRTFAAMRRMLLDAGSGALVVIELEDIHWIDETSESFLDSLVEVMGAARIMLLLTYRSGYQPRWLEKSYATQITMRRLSADESQQLIDSVLERVDAVAREDPTERIPELLQKAEGNPLFLEELAHALTGPGQAHAPVIPDTVQGILMARIDRLPEAQKQLLRTASVLGRSFPADLLAAIWERSEPLEPLLEDLRRREFLYKSPSEEQTLHFFKHALTQEVAYESLLSRRRRELHRLAAATLESRYADRLEDVYDRLIFHYPRAGEPEKTVHYLTLFADRAARHYAHAEAAKALREALRQAEKLPPEARDQQIVAVLLQLADSLLPLAGFRETLELCQQHSERVERLDEPRLSAQYHFWLAHTYTYLGHQEATRRHARLAIAGAETCGDETTQGKACYVLGRNGFWSGQFAEGIEYSLRAVVLLERSGEPWWQGQAYWVAGFNHYVLGEIDKGIEALERAYEIGEALDDYRLDTSWSLGYFHASLGDWKTGLEKCRRGLERSQDPLNSAVATGFLGFAYLEKGDLEEAIATLVDSVARLRETGMQQILGWFTIFLCEARLAAKETEEARDMAEQGLEITRQAEFRYGVALALRALGRVELADGRLDEAARRFDEALAEFTSLATPFEMARTHLERARLARRRSDGAAARPAIAEAHRLFERVGAQGYLERTLELAEAVGASVPA